MEQRLIKPQPHTSLVFNLLFSPQRPRVGEEEREEIDFFLASLGKMIFSRFFRFSLNNYMNGHSFKTQRIYVISKALLSLFKYI